MLLKYLLFYSNILKIFASIGFQFQFSVYISLFLEKTRFLFQPSKNKLILFLTVHGKRLLYFSTGYENNLWPGYTGLWALKSIASIGRANQAEKGNRSKGGSSYFGLSQGRHNHRAQTHLLCQAARCACGENCKCGPTCSCKKS